MGEALTGLELRSMVTSGGKLVLNLEEVRVDAPGPDEVVVVELASPGAEADQGEAGVEGNRRSQRHVAPHRGIDRLASALHLGAARELDHLPANLHGGRFRRLPTKLQQVPSDQGPAHLGARR